MTWHQLDTNIISDLVRNLPGLAAQRVAGVSEDAVCAGIIGAAELRYFPIGILRTKS